jgi:hypothetical protein
MTRLNHSFNLRSSQAFYLGAILEVESRFIAVAPVAWEAFMRYVAVKFETDNELLKAMHELDELSAHEPVSYDVVKGSAILVIPAHLAATPLALFEKLGLNAHKIPARPFSDLKPEDQWQRRRGYLGKKKSA